MTAKPGPALILGVDPGPSTGIAVLRLDARRLGRWADAFQCSIGAAPWLLARICEHMIAGAPAAGQVEGFAPGTAPGRSCGPGGSPATRCRPCRRPRPARHPDVQQI